MFSAKYTYDVVRLRHFPHSIVDRVRLHKQVGWTQTALVRRETMNPELDLFR